MDQIFRPVGPGGNFHHNAVVEDFDEHLLAIGFARLGDLGVEEWRRSGPDDLLFVPIVYSYRHALELVLKAALTETAACLRAEGDPDPDLDYEALRRWLAGPRGAGHSLQKLATRLDEWVQRLKLEGLPKDVHEVLVSLHKLDPKGDAFRYATVREQESFKAAPRPGVKLPHAPQGHVDVLSMGRHFKASFEVLSSGLMTELEQVREYQAEMRAEVDW